MLSQGLNSMKNTKLAKLKLSLFLSIPHFSQLWTTSGTVRYSLPQWAPQGTVSHAPSAGDVLIVSTHHVGRSWHYWPAFIGDKTVNTVAVANPSPAKLQTWVNSDYMHAKLQYRYCDHIQDDIVCLHTFKYFNLKEWGPSDIQELGGMWVLSFLLETCYCFATASIQENSFLSRKIISLQYCLEILKKIYPSTPLPTSPNGLSLYN